MNINVSAGQSLQAAVDRAMPGDVLSLEAGASFPGTIVLPFKSGDVPITLQSSRQSEIDPVKRISPSDAGKMPKIVSTGFGNAAIQTVLGAHHWNLSGIEVTQQDVNAFTYSLLWLGSFDADQDSLDKVAHHLKVDHCYIHALGESPLKRGIDLNSAYTDITNCYISGFKVVGQEAQAILGVNGPGPFKINNNYLEAAGENVMFGGADPRIQNLVPSDIEFRGNTCFKPLSWRGIWLVKNLFELKNARRVVIDGNTFENCWSDGQAGFAIVFTPRNSQNIAPWSTVEDVQFINNIIRHAASGIQILGTDNIYPSQTLKRLLIKNCLFEDIVAATWGPGLANKLFQFSQGSEDVTIDHVTAKGDAPALYFVGGTPMKRLSVTKGAFENGTIASEVGHGNAALAAFAPDAVVTGNILAQVLRPDLYPANNEYPATLPSTLPPDTGYSGSVAPEPSPIPPPIPEEYRTETMLKDTESARSALYQRMFNDGWAAWREMSGPKIQFRRFR